jgi:hypothetical protein
MCKIGDNGFKTKGTIFAECRDEILRQTNTERLSNQEMYKVLIENNGCMNGRQRVDSHRLHMVASH